MEQADGNSISPVSSPAAFCIMVIPLSPATIVQWIEAAPRHLGNKEACVFMQSNLDISKTVCGNIIP
jgi:hypothetical protein